MIEQLIVIVFLFDIVRQFIFIFINKFLKYETKKENFSNTFYE